MNLIKSIFRYYKKVDFFIYKLRLHLLYSFSFRDLRDKNHKIREVAHSIDKSMTMKDFNPNRGQTAREKLKRLCESESNIVDENKLLLEKINSNKTSFGFDAQLELPTVRRFIDKSVNFELIKQCVSRANKYPKSCSREAVSIHFPIDKDSVNAQLFSGFSCIEGAYQLAVIVVDLSAYDARSEVFAPYIDGSIFATGFCQSLWDIGVGSCMLNWSSQSKTSERSLRKNLNLNNHEIVVMGIVFGYPEFIPFHAPRRNANEILRRHP